MMTLAAGEFIRRFLQHVLPSGADTVRYYGLWVPADRQQLHRAQMALGGAAATPVTISVGASGMQIRKAQHGDLDAWIRLRHALWPDHDSDGLAAETGAMLESHDEVCFLVTDESSQLVGFISSQSSALSSQFSIPNPRSAIRNTLLPVSSLKSQASSLKPPVSRPTSPRSRSSRDSPARRG